MPEALHILAEQWKVLWQRELPWKAHLREILDVSPVVQPWEWNPVTASAILAEAVKLKGKSGSVDGWLGDELCDLPLCVFDRAAVLFAAYEKAGLVPQIWTQARQAHIPKENAVDGIHEAEKLRPITVLSSWYRLFGSARLKTKDAQRWLAQWWPEAACGGK